MTYTKTSPFLRFSPFWAFFRQKKHSYPPPAKKTATEAHRRPDSPAAPSRPSALRSAANNRALVPPGLRRRRPPRRRFAVRWRGRAVSGARGGGQLLPRPLAASPSSVWSAWPLAALSHASARRAGAWPLRPSGAPAACLRALAWPMAAALAVAWGRAGRSVSRGLAPLPPPRPSKGAPPFPPSCSPAARTRAEIIAGDGGRALVPRACGAVGCARGARPCIPAVSVVCLPASGRARSACRAVCAVRALRRASPPSSGGQARVVKGVQSSSVSIGGRARAFRRSDRRLTAAIWPKPRKKAPALTKSGGIGRFPTPKRPAERPKMGYGVPRSVRYGSIVPSLTA